MPDSADTTISTRRPAAWCAAAMRPIVSQRSRVDTLVPPNLTTTHGAPDGSGAARTDGKGLPAQVKTGFFLASQHNAIGWPPAGRIVAARSYALPWLSLPL